MEPGSSGGCPNDPVHLNSTEPSSSINSQPPFEVLTDPRKEALMIINMQNDSFFPQNDLCTAENPDFVARLKGLIPYFRNDTKFIWVCTHLVHKATLFQEGARGAEIYGELQDTVDEAKDLTVIKHNYSAFDETSLSMALRKMGITHVYLCGCLTNVGVYSTAIDAVQHGLCVTVIEDCLGYRSKERHEVALRHMVDSIGVKKIDSERVINGYMRLPAPGMEPLIKPLEGLCLDTDATIVPLISLCTRDTPRYPTKKRHFSP